MFFTAKCINIGYDFMTLLKTTWLDFYNLPGCRNEWGIGMILATNDKKNAAVKEQVSDARCRMYFNKGK